MIFIDINLTDTMEIMTIATQKDPDAIQLQEFKKKIAKTLKRGYTIKEGATVKHGMLTQKLYKIRKINDRF